ncbi:MAG: hypothetical protein H6581_08760 [Bacteroidia bacterium]|nr:hypothetical protein [Bacteroidia bacterium]
METDGPEEESPVAVPGTQVEIVPEISQVETEPAVEVNVLQGEDSVAAEPFNEEPFLNLQAYSAGGVVLGKSMFEIKLYNNLYTQTAWFDADGKRAMLDRSTYFTSNLGLYYAVSNQVNVGLDFVLRAVRNAPPEQSPLDVFRFRNSDSSRVAISYFGPKVRFNPIRSHKNLTLQTAFWIPYAGQLQGPPFLEWDRYQWWISVYYTALFARNKMQIFAAVEYVPRIRRSSYPILKSDLIVYNKALVSYFITRQVTVYGLGEFGPSLGLGANSASSYYLAFGAGAKYFLAHKFTFDLLYTHFVAGRAAGAGQTFNLGLSYVFKS